MLPGRGTPLFLEMKARVTAGEVHRIFNQSVSYSNRILSWQH